MKKVLSAVLVCVFLFFFISCGSKTGDEGDTGDSDDAGNTASDSDAGNTGDSGDSGDTAVDPCDPNPCTEIENSDGECSVESGVFICGCNENYYWDGSECLEGRIVDCENEKPENSVWSSSNPEGKLVQHFEEGGWVPAADTCVWECEEFYELNSGKDGCVEDDSEFAGGSGTEDDPYKIATPAHLNNVRNYLDAYFIQIRDINMETYLSKGGAGYNNGAGWDPIGYSLSEYDQNPFKGHYDGQGYVINNLRFTRPQENYVGLFGFMKEASVINLGITNIDFTGRDGVGGLMGAGMSFLAERVYTTGVVSGGQFIGGITGISVPESPDGEYLSNDVIECYCKVRLVPDDPGYSNGIDGSRYSANERTFWDADVAETFHTLDAVKSYGLSTEEMKNPVTYAKGGWDLKNIWYIDENVNEGYPTLRKDPIKVCSGSYFAGGSGIESDPYQVSSVQELDNIRYCSGKHFIQTKDIDLKDYLSEGSDGFNFGAGWRPVGSPNHAFSGTYDGGGYIIDNLFFDYLYATNTGLFGNVSDFTIKNLSVKKINIKGLFRIGGLIGFAYSSTIINCSAEGKINGRSEAGGVLGCGNVVTVSGSFSNIDHNSGWMAIGGFAGCFFNSVVTDSYSISSITYDQQKYSTGVGGFAGEFFDSSISRCYSETEIIGGEEIGGLIGSNQNSSVQDCYSRGSVEGNDIVGGLVGKNLTEIPLTNCYSVSTVKGDSRFGPLVGSSSDYYGINSFWNSDITNDGNTYCGTGKTTAEMKTESTYTDWDFDSVWDIDGSTNDGYPFLR